MAKRRPPFARLGSLAAGLLLCLGARAAEATTVLHVPLETLAKQSDAIVIGTPVSSTSEWTTLGGSQRIVTTTKVRIDETLRGASRSFIVIKTLGGRVGDIGQIVHGEAPLATGKKALLFLRVGANGQAAVTGMAQGHYPVRADASGITYVQASPGLDHVVKVDAKAASLVGKTLAKVRELIRELPKP